MKTDPKIGCDAKKMTPKQQVQFAITSGGMLEPSLLKSGLAKHEMTLKGRLPLVTTLHGRMEYRFGQFWSRFYGIRSLFLK